MPKEDKVNVDAEGRVQCFDEFGFAIFEKDFEPENPRCHDYSYSISINHEHSAKEVGAWKRLLTNWDTLDQRFHTKLQRLMRNGVPKHFRCTLWKNLLGSESLEKSSHFSYKANLVAIREQMVDLGISEYGAEGNALQALSEALKTNNELKHSGHVDVNHIRQILLDLDRTYPTHNLYMGNGGPAREGKASLFRVLSLYARYNPTIGYCQGMSYIAGMLLMHMEEKDAFWCFAALIERQKYLQGYFDDKLSRIQRHAAVFEKLMKQRFPQLSEHIENHGLQPLMFVTPWFMCLFTNLTCWDTVLAIWDLILVDGVTTIFQVGLAIMKVAESRLLATDSLIKLLPQMLHLSNEIVQYDTLLPAIWETHIEKWEIHSLQAVIQEEKQLKERQSMKRRHKTDQEYSSPVVAKRAKHNSESVPTRNGSVLSKLTNMFVSTNETAETGGSTDQSKSLAHMRVAYHRHRNSPRKNITRRRSPRSLGAGSALRSPGLAKQLESNRKNVSPCEVANENSFQGDLSFSFATPVRRSPRIARLHGLLRDINTPSEKRLVSSKASVQHSFKMFHTPTPLRKSQRSPVQSNSTASPSFASPELELRPMQKLQ
ncbi:unnamed protein product [Owenia fusiformis]|uniref:Rab-GAP TBC domain-containing protein n=1 Tax=Owenia fusiformis TaxID=6347 RepID=A0A8S4NXV9_OWEFU|nr:unnamed protein product [Owenia fusiformis]